MTDAEFWEHVYPGGVPLDGDDDYWIEGPPADIEVRYSGDPCTICGSVGACGYDSEGQPMIHVLPDSQD